MCDCVRVWLCACVFVCVCVRMAMTNRFRFKLKLRSRLGEDSPQNERNRNIIIIIRIIKQSLKNFWTTLGLILYNCWTIVDHVEDCWNTFKLFLDSHLFIVSGYLLFFNLYHVVNNASSQKEKDGDAEFVDDVVDDLGDDLKDHSEYHPGPHPCTSDYQT